MIIFKSILRSLIFSILAIPTITVVLLSYLLSTNNVMGLKAAYDFVLNKVYYGICFQGGAFDFSLNCVAERSYLVLFIAVGVGFLALIYTLFEKAFLNTWIGRKTASAVSVTVLFLPVLYYAILYLPISWDANNPAAFIFMLSLMSAHIASIIFLIRVHSIVFNKPVDKKKILNF
ncbi:MAG: hypothetical protein ABL930_07970 [Pseudobdellovibrio sp.]